MSNSHSRTVYLDKSLGHLSNELLQEICGQVVPGSKARIHIDGAHFVVEVGHAGSFLVQEDRETKEIRLIGAISAVTEEALNSRPPLNAQFALDLFLPDQICESFLGDLEERYRKKRQRLGGKRVDWWYRKQVVTSLWPLFRSAA